jgi:hypothetical protein
MAKYFSVVTIMGGWVGKPVRVLDAAIISILEKENYIFGKKGKKDGGIKRLV